MITPRTLATAALATLLLAGCQSVVPEVVTTQEPGQPSVSGWETPPPEGTAPEPEATAIAQLQFSAVDVVSSETVEGTSLAGKDVILWFWAPWCPTCQWESTSIREVLDLLPEDVEMIGVAGLGPQESMQDFVTDYEVGGMRHLVDADGSIWQRFGVATQPAYAFISAEGDVSVVIGSLGTAGIMDRVDALVS